MRSHARRFIDLALVIAGIVTFIASAWPLHVVHSLPGALILAPITCLPWLARDRHPVGSLVVIGVGLFASIGIVHAYNWATVATVVLLFLVGYEGERRRSLLIGVIAAVGLAALVAALIPVLEPHGDLGAAGQRVGVALGALVAGELVRSRVALRVAEREKADRELSELRERAQRQATAERLRIARELHDTLAHALVAINVRAGVTAHLGVSPEAAEALIEIKGVSAQALGELRTTLDVLRDRDTPAPRDPSLGLGAVPGLLDHAQAAGLRAEAEISLAEATIPSVIDHAGYRIVQEALTNVVRHSGASQATVRVRARGGVLSIVVVDDGRGAVSSVAEREHKPGYGLQGMAERAAAVGGTVTAGPRPDRGWEVAASLPLTGADV